MSSRPHPPLIRIALLTAPLIAIMMVTPLFIVSRLEMKYFWVMMGAVSLITCICWVLQIFLLRFRERFGKYPWVQPLISSAVMIGFSLIIFYVFQPTIPTWAERFPLVRFVNVVVVNIIIYILIHLRLLTDVKAKLASENAELRFANLEKQHRLLKEQVNPHFLFNALGTAKSLVRRDPNLAESYIVRLSDFLRAGLSDAADKVSLKEELKLVRDYVELQQIRFRDALRVQVEVDESFSGFQVPFFSVLTLVENAIKHNAMSPESPLVIRIMTISDEKLVVENTIQAKHKPELGNNSGLENLRERCRLLGQGELAVEEMEGKFRVILPVLRPSTGA